MTDAGEISLRRTPARWKVLVHQPSSISWRRRGEAATIWTGHTSQVGGRSVWRVCTRWFSTSCLCGTSGTAPSEHLEEGSSLPLPGLGTPFTLPSRKPRARTGLTPWDCTVGLHFSPLGLLGHPILVLAEFGFPTGGLVFPALARPGLTRTFCALLSFPLLYATLQ